MSTAEVSEIEPTVIQRRIFLSFCATALVGVLLCVAYLAGRTTWFAPRTTPVREASGINPPASVPIATAPSEVTAAVAPPVALPVARAEKPIPGDTYLQMAAVDRGMAEALVEVLRKKGMQGILAPGPTEDIFRVLVGPVRDAADLARVKADLQAAGFTSFARRHRSQPAQESSVSPGSPPR